MSLQVRDEAKADLAEAASWYEARDHGLGQTFLDEIERVFVRIERNPAGYPVWHRGLRKALCHRFPYAIYFGQDGADWIIHGVLHQRQLRDKLDNRLT
jgi:toxin ParE1/3/4